MKKWGALFVALGLALLFLFWPTELTDEEQIQQLLGQVESGFEEGSIKEVAATISESYSADEHFKKLRKPWEKTDRRKKRVRRSSLRDKLS